MKNEEKGQTVCCLNFLTQMFKIVNLGKGMGLKEMKDLLCSGRDKRMVVPSRGCNKQTAQDRNKVTISELYEEYQIPENINSNAKKKNKKAVVTRLRIKLKKLSSVKLEERQKELYKVDTYLWNLCVHVFFKICGCKRNESLPSLFHHR